MKPEEYDELIYDPSDFMVRKYWPRAYSRLAGLAGLMPLREGQGYFAGPFAFAAFGTPAGQEALDALREAGAAGAQDRDGSGRSRPPAGGGRLPARAGAPMAPPRSTWWATSCAAARA